ncbi:MAG: methyltransferase domain-containing protein [Candidatus Bathyarchaeia archaeon]
MREAEDMMGSMRTGLRNLIRKLEGAGFNIWNPSSDSALHPGAHRSPRDFYPQDLTTTFQSIAPFVPSPMDVVRKMLELAELKPGEVLFDLGCGDGRIVLVAGKDFGSRAVGVDLNAMLINQARNEAEKLGLGKVVRFIDGDMFDVDLSSADVVTMYLLTSANEKVRPKLESELRIGARVVTHDFPIINWRCRSRLNFEGESGKHVLYLYVWRGDETSVKRDGTHRVRFDD